MEVRNSTKGGTVLSSLVATAVFLLLLRGKEKVAKVNWRNWRIWSSHHLNMRLLLYLYHISCMQKWIYKINCVALPYSRILVRERNCRLISNHSIHSHISPIFLDYRLILWKNIKYLTPVARYIICWCKYSTWSSQLRMDLVVSKKIFRIGPVQLSPKVWIM